MSAKRPRSIESNSSFVVSAKDLERRKRQREEESMDTDGTSPGISDQENMHGRENAPHIVAKTSASKEMKLGSKISSACFSQKIQEDGSKDYSSNEKNGLALSSSSCVVKSLSKSIQDENFRWMLKSEASYRKYTPEAKYMKYRPALVEWLMDLCADVGCRRVVLATSVRYMDRILQSTRVVKENMQLVAMCCFLIASKFEGPEDKVPSMTEAAYLVNQNYDPSTIRDVELHMLKKLDWNLTDFTAYHFLRHFFSKGVFLPTDRCADTPDQADLSKFWKKACYHNMEDCMKEYALEQFRPSVLAMSLVILLRDEWEFPCAASDLSTIFGLDFENGSLMSEVEACKKVLIPLLYPDYDGSTDSNTTPSIAKRSVSKINEVSPRGVSDLWSEGDSQGSTNVMSVSP